MWRLATVLVGAAVVASCTSYDNSSDTDRSGSALTNAESAVSEKSSDVVRRADDIEREKREMLQRQQKLADDETALAAERQQLGSAQDALGEAHRTYATAVSARLSKLDATLATLATKADARSKDALVGLRARREHLVARVQAMPATKAQHWVEYTKDVDATFDAIERDLDAAR
jgi:vacuolar-type H+-ATPase subunit I/STV1